MVELSKSEIGKCGFWGGKKSNFIPPSYHTPKQNPSVLVKKKKKFKNI